MKKSILLFLSISILAAAAICVGAAIKGDASHSAEKETAYSVHGGYSAVTTATAETQTAGKETAKQTALEHAGLAEDSVTFTKAMLDENDGKAVYDVEFHTADAQYDYEIDAATGTVLSSDYNALTHRSDQTPTNSGSQYIGEDAAKEAAFTHAGVHEADTSFIKIKLDRDDGIVTYDIEFYTGGTEYDYEVDALTGAVLAYSHEKFKSADSQSTGGDIGLEKAKSAAYAAAGLTESPIKLQKAKLEYDDGLSIYKIEFTANEMEYEVEIDASTGAVIDFEAESFYD